MKTNKNLTSFNTHLDEQYGLAGTSSREKYEKEFEDFLNEECLAASDCKYKNIHSYDELLDIEYGKKGSSKREEYNRKAQQFVYKELSKIK